MKTNHFCLLAFITLLFGLMIPARSRAGENGFRLIYIGSLSGYVKLCG